ncbi:hypothetical protein X766_33285 [Mesorhizobium sp. LSJC255A00]|nr:hypothetical protein X766_33285 [Mesorhizobium sp. LSJC255A00]
MPAHGKDLFCEGDLSIRFSIQRLSNVFMLALALTRAGATRYGSGRQGAAECH